MLQTLETGLADLGPHGRGQLEPHRSQTARGHKRVSFIEEQELGGPHLVLPDTSHDHGIRIVLHQLVELRQHLLGLENVRLRDRKRGVLVP